MAVTSSAFIEWPITYSNVILFGNYTLQGYNGSQLWDTAFAVQAIVSTKLGEEFAPTLRKAHTYIKKSQVNLTPSLNIHGAYFL